jgi:hypothetical protein
LVAVTPLTEIVTSHSSWSRKSLAIPPSTWPLWAEQSISTVAREVADLELGVGDPASVCASHGRHSSSSLLRLRLLPGVGSWTVSGVLVFE